MCSLHFSIFFCSVFLHISNFFGDKGTIFFEYYKIFVFNSVDCKAKVAKECSVIDTKFYVIVLS